MVMGGKLTLQNTFELSLNPIPFPNLFCFRSGVWQTVYLSDELIYGFIELIYQCTPFDLYYFLFSVYYYYRADPFSMEVYRENTRERKPVWHDLKFGERSSSRYTLVKKNEGWGDEDTFHNN